MTSLLDILRLAAIVAAAGALGAAAFHDVRSYLIPNRFAAVIAFCFLLASLGLPWRDTLTGLGLGGTALAVGIVFFALGWLGGGDVKLLAAVTLWVPAPLFASFAMVTSLTGAALGILLLTPLRHFLPPPPAAYAASSGAARALRQPMPFAVAIAAGGLFVLFARLAG